MGRQLTGNKLMKGAAVASAIAAILAFAAYKSGRDATLSVESVKATLKDTVKDINLPQPVSAVDANKLLEDTKRIVKKGRKVSKKLYKDLEKEAAKQAKKAQRNLQK